MIKLPQKTDRLSMFVALAIVVILTLVAINIYAPEVKAVPSIALFIPAVIALVVILNTGWGDRK